MAMNLKQKKINFKPRIKLNHNIDTHINEIKENESNVM